MPAIPVTQSTATFADIEKIITEYLAERDWLQNASRNIATSIVLEASELLEHYQWSDRPVGSHQDLRLELADVLIYAFQYAHANNIDMAAAIQEKLEITRKKYPAEDFKDKSAEDRSSAWMQAKLKHKKEGL